MFIYVNIYIYIYIIYIYIYICMYIYIPTFYNDIRLPVHVFSHAAGMRILTKCYDESIYFHHDVVTMAKQLSLCSEPVLFAILKHAINSK